MCDVNTVGYFAFFILCKLQNVILFWNAVITHNVHQTVIHTTSMSDFVSVSSKKENVFIVAVWEDGLV